MHPQTLDSSGRGIEDRALATKELHTKHDCQNDSVACDNQKERDQFPSDQPGFVSNFLSQQTPLVHGTIFFQTYDPGKLHKLRVSSEPALSRSCHHPGKCFKSVSKVTSPQVSAAFRCKSLDHQNTRKT